MKMNCIAIDDEELALSKIRRFSGKLEHINLKATFTNPLEALAFLKENKIDIIFLDIQMDGFSGIEFLEACSNLPYVIITSAFDSYAIKSYEFNVVDYLLKPIQLSRFVKAVEKAFAFYKKDLHLNKNQNSKTISENDLILVKSGRELFKIKTSDILYVEGMKDYLSIVTANKKILTLMSFKTILEKLPEEHFCRIHKSYIIQLGKIDSSSTKQVVISEKVLPISNSYKNEFENKFKMFRLSRFV